MRWAGLEPIHKKIAAIAAVLVIMTGALILIFIVSSDDTNLGGITDNTAPAVVGETGVESAPDDLSGGNLTATATNTWMTLAIVAMALATMVSVAVSFYLYRWRKILLSDPKMLVPEKLGGWLNDLGVNAGKLADSINLGVTQISQQSLETNQNVSNLVETSMTLQEALDQRDTEIRRLKRGYDAEIFRKFISRFIRVDQAAEDFQRAGRVDESSLEQIRRLLEDAFAECGVESFAPAVGSDYRTATGVADSPKTVKAEKPEDEFKIAEVLESGYLIRGPEDHEVIVPAKVKIYTA